MGGSSENFTSACRAGMESRCGESRLQKGGGGALGAEAGPRPQSASMHCGILMALLGRQAGRRRAGARRAGERATRPAPTWKSQVVKSALKMRSSVAQA